MKKTAVFLLSLLLSVAFVFADDNANVFKTTKELTAYKEYVAPSSTPPAVTLAVYQDSNYSQSVSDGNDVVISALNTQINAFYWKLTGNLFGQVQISFTFSPMYLGQMSRLGTMEATEANRVIPYTVQLTHDKTKINNKNATVNQSPSGNPSSGGNKNDYYETINGTNTTVYFKFGDSITPYNPSFTVLTSPYTQTITYDLSTYTKRRKKTSNNSNSYTDYTDTIETLGTTWERTGKCQVTLNLTDGSWDNSGDTVTPLGGQYQSYVIVTLTTGS